MKGLVIEYGMVIILAILGGVLIKAFSVLLDIISFLPI